VVPKKIIKENKQDTTSFDQFDPEQFIMAMFEAERNEVVRDFVMDARLGTWNDFKIKATTPVSEFRDNLEKASRLTISFKKKQ